MPINRPLKVWIALVLGGAAVVAAAQGGAQALGAQPGAWPVSATAGSQRNPDAVPPILAPLSPSEVAEMRRAEVQEWQVLSYRLPAGARYSDAEMTVFAAEGYGRS